MEQSEDPTFQRGDEPEVVPRSRIIMSDGTARTTLGFGGIIMAVQGGNIIRHDSAGNIIPDDVSGVQHPAPGVAVYGDNITVNTHPEAPDNQQ